MNREWKIAIAYLFTGVMLGGAGIFHYCAKVAEKNLAADHAIIADQQDQIRGLQHTIGNMETVIDAEKAQHSDEVIALDKITAAAESQAEGRRDLAQEKMLTDVRLNACEVAAKQLAAQRAQLPTDAQSVVAALLKAFLR